LVGDQVLVAYDDQKQLWVIPTSLPWQVPTVFNPMDPRYGAKFDGSTDDTVAIQAAANAAKAAKGILYLPPLTAKITATLDLTGDYLKVVMAPGGKIVQYTNNIPVVVYGGAQQRFDGLRLAYNSVQPSTNTSAACFSATTTTPFHSEYTNMLLENGAYGIYNFTKVPFSCKFDTIRINGYSISAILHGNTSVYSTGNVWNNVYTQNNFSGSNTTCTGPIIDVEFCDEQIFNMLNLEWCNPTVAALKLKQCKGFVANGLHLEGLAPTTGNANNGLIEVFTNSKAIINGLTLSNVTIPASMGTFGILWPTFGPNHIVVNGQTLNGNTVSTTSTSFVGVNCGGTPGTGASCNVTGADTTGLAALVANDVAATPQVRRYNDNWYLPTADPHVVNKEWNNVGVRTISAG
jgi:hypothetical protein